MPPVIRWIMSSAMSMFTSPSNNSSPSSNPNTPSCRHLLYPPRTSSCRLVVSTVCTTCPLAHRGPRGLIWRVEAPRSHHRLHEAKYRLHEVVSVHAQEAVLHAGPNLRQRIEHDPSDIRAGPVEDRDELLRCGLPDLPPVLGGLEPEEHLGLLLEAEDR